VSPQEFNAQMLRLENRWKNVYGTELKAVIWKELSTLPPGCFERICTRLIGEERQAPLISEFRREATVEREKSWHREKEQYSRDAKNWMTQKMSSTSEEQNLMFETIRRRILGLVPDQDWKCFQDLITTRFGS
jgi:hypothetical protein